MAYANEYTITYADAQGRENIIYLDLEGGAGPATALDSNPANANKETGVPAESPLIFEFGGNNDDEYRSINPTALQIRLVVENSTIFNAVSGDASFDWRVRWIRDSVEKWRGYLITDEIEQPFDLPGLLTLRAVCGIKELDGVEWTPTTPGAATFITHIQDQLSNLGGTTLGVGYYANWHGRTTAQDSGNTAVSGNSYSVYSFKGSAFNDPYDANKKTVTSFALQNAVGAFGGKICMSDGLWRVYQRDALASAYTMDLTGGGTESISAYSLTDAQIYRGAVRSNAPAYYKTQVSYNHFPEDTGFLLNGDFDFWTGSTPDNWTLAGGSSFVTQRTNNVSNIPALIPINDGYYAELADRAHGSTGAGNDYGTDAADDATYGIYQDSQFDLRANSEKIHLSFSARHIGNSSETLFFFYSIWLDGDAGTDYFWDAANKTWETSGGGTFLSPGSGSKMPRVASATWFDYSVETDGVPDAGTLRLTLWTVVDKGGNTSGIGFKNVRLGYEAGDRGDRVKTLVVSTNTEATSGLVRPEELFFIGEGPSINHDGAILNAGTPVFFWQAGAYGTGGSTNQTLEALHAKSINDARGNKPARLRLTFRPSSGSYWPHQPLLYDSAYYSCVSLRYDSRKDEYTGEWLEVESSGVVTDEEERYGDEDVRPTDFDKPIDFDPPLTGGGKVDVTSLGTDLFNGTRFFFPRFVDASSDYTPALENNYITGTLELAQTAKIETAGYATGGGVYIDYQKLEITSGSDVIKIDNSGILFTAGSGNVNKVRWSDGSEIYSGGGPGVMTISPDTDLSVTADSIKVNPGIIRLVNAADVGEAGFTTLYSSGGDLFKRDGTGTDYKILTLEELPLSVAGAAKGDIIVHNGTNWIDLSVGTNDQVLTADSAAASGVKWATPAPGVTTFVALTDTPANYTSAANRFVKVNGAANALEFVADPGYLLPADVGSSVQAYSANLDALAADPLTASTAASTYQPLDADLTDIAALTKGNGQIMTTTTADGYTLLPGGTDGYFLKMSFGTPSWHASTDIVALGTISTGVWQATAIADAYIASSATWNAKLDDITGESIGSLSDVTITSVGSGEVLGYNGGWINRTLSEAGIQPSDANLTQLAALSATGNQLAVGIGGSWSGLSAGSVGDMFVVGAMGTIGWVAKNTIDVGDFNDDGTYLSAATAASTYQPLDADLTDIAALTKGNGQLMTTTTLDGYVLLSAGTDGQFLKMSFGTPSWHDTTDITALGTVTSGTWQATAIADAYIASSATWNAKLDDITGESISSLSDITITSVSNGEVLGYSSGWINRTLAEAGIQPQDDNLDDISAITPTNGGMISYVGGAYSQLAAGANDSFLVMSLGTPGWEAPDDVIALMRGVKCMYSNYTVTTVFNTVSESTLLGTGTGSTTAASGTLVQGATYRIRASGVMSSNGSNTITLNINLGSTSLVSTSLSVGSYSDRHWSVDVDIVVASVSGTTSSVRAQGVFRHRMAPSNNLTLQPFETTSVVGITNTADQDLDVTATWTSADTNDLIRCTNATVEKLV